MSSVPLWHGIRSCGSVAGHGEHPQQPLFAHPLCVHSLFCIGCIFALRNTGCASQQSRWLLQWFAANGCLRFWPRCQGWQGAERLSLQRSYHRCVCVCVCLPPLACSQALQPVIELARPFDRVASNRLCRPRRSTYLHCSSRSVQMYTTKAPMRSPDVMRAAHAPTAHNSRSACRTWQTHIVLYRWAFGTQVATTARRPLWPGT